MNEKLNKKQLPFIELDRDKWFDIMKKFNNYFGCSMTSFVKNLMYFSYFDIFEFEKYLIERCNMEENESLCDYILKHYGQEKLNFVIDNLIPLWKFNFKERK